MTRFFASLILLAGLTSCMVNQNAPVPTSETPPPLKETSPTEGTPEKISTVTPEYTLPALETATLDVTPTSSPTSSPTSDILPPTSTAVINSNEYIIADHTVVNKFSEIPDEAIKAATDLTLLLRHASIGDNIYLGLTCIWGNFPDRRPATCGDYYDLKYDPSNWTFENRGNPGWPGKVNDFITEVEQRSADFEVLSFALDYVDGLDSGDARPISVPETFQTRFIDKIEALEADHPDKIFIWWTMSLPRLGHENRQKFNEMLRAYASEHNKILFDIADIEAHDPDGNLVTDESGFEILFAGYTNEVRSGHLNQLGRERVARAFWWIMARIAGWDGN